MAAPTTHTAADSGVDTITAFLAALEDVDIDRAMTHTHPDITYQNVPLPPARGRAAVERQLRLLARSDARFEARIHHIAAADGVVLTERTDVIEIQGVRAEFWVCGTFELRDGRIVAWRDYFDWLAVTGAFVKGLGRAIVARARRL